MKNNPVAPSDEESSLSDSEDDMNKQTINDEISTGRESDNNSRLKDRADPQAQDPTPAPKKSKKKRKKVKTDSSSSNENPPKSPRTKGDGTAMETV